MTQWVKSNVVACVLFIVGGLGSYGIFVYNVSSEVADTRAKIIYIEVKMTELGNDVDYLKKQDTINKVFQGRLEEQYKNIIEKLDDIKKTQ